jgi:glycosyltransferase involved in cell wall biosynthesis
LELIQSIKTERSVVVYYCVADFALLTTNVEALARSERELLSLSDLVLTNCSALATHCKQWNENVHVFPPGVDLSAFNAESRDADAVMVNSGPASSLPLTTLPRPIIGYIGGMHKYVAFSMLEEMAESRPEWSWVFVGPLQTTPGKLRELPNVYFAGQQPHEELRNYVQEFDVCIVPYVNSPETATVVPVKLNEYLAVGKPVVSTELPTVCDFDREHGVVFMAKDNAESFLQSIERALSRGEDETIVARRRGVASLADWGPRFSEMSGLVAAQIKNK